MISKGPGLGCLFPAPRSGFNPSRRAQAVPTASGAAHVTCECGVGSHRDGPMAPAAGSDTVRRALALAGPGRPCRRSRSRRDGHRDAGRYWKNIDSSLSL